MKKNFMITLSNVDKLPMPSDFQDTMTENEYQQLIRNKNIYVYPAHEYMLKYSFYNNDGSIRYKTFDKNRTEVKVFRLRVDKDVILKTMASIIGADRYPEIMDDFIENVVFDIREDGCSIKYRNYIMELTGTDYVAQHKYNLVLKKPIYSQIVSINSHCLNQTPAEEFFDQIANNAFTESFDDVKMLVEKCHLSKMFVNKWESGKSVLTINDTIPYVGELIPNITI